jgi:hypothetical protein
MSGRPPRFAPLALVLVLAAPVAAGEKPENASGHWAFQPLTRSAVPPLRSAPRPSVRNPIDNFVFAALEKHGLAPSPEADRHALVRRVYFDAIGLPPTPAQVEAFLTDTAPDAYEKLVDRLLASPQFGERWAQHWLDVVRFAETNGYELDADRPHAWRYRDYVIRSFNADKPYDQFLTEQIAGDLLAAGKGPQTKAELLIATGMHRCGQAHVVVGTDAAAVRQENLTEMVNGFGAAVLGLTVACARCHDHKFDPLPQAEYYRFQAFFASAFWRDVPIASKDEQARFQATSDEVAKKAEPLRVQVSAIEAPYRTKLAREKRAALDATARKALETPDAKRTPEQKKLVAGVQPLLKVSWDEVLDALSPDDRAKRQRLRDEIHRLEQEIPSPPAQAWAVQHEDPIPKTFVLKRGEVSRKGPEVVPGFPQVLVSADVAPKTRLDLAAWLTRPDHPLTSRVIVNRLWQHYFGRGIVRTPNDFGTRGDPPTHPELLDWLASELVKSADGRPWALKRIHRLILTSAAYRQASNSQSAVGNPESKDPENKLLWRQNRKRLEAEAIRDAVLAAAGSLNREAGGPSVRIPLEPEVYDLIFTEAEPDHLWPVTPDPLQHTRRSIYLFAKRNVRQPVLEAFDQPDTLNSCAARGVSTFAPQALILMNGPLTMEQSRGLASRLLWEGNTPEEWVRGLYTRALARPPREGELAESKQFLIEQRAALRERLRTAKAIAVPGDLPSDADPATATALADLCLAVFNTNEFVYVP